ncbi:hypothetical protein [Actinopolymorpha pittospori]
MLDEKVNQDFGQVLRRRGVLILALFAVVWAAAGISGLPFTGTTQLLVGAVAVLVTVVALALGLRPQGTAGTRPRDLPEGWRRRVGQVNLVELVLVLVTIFGCARLGVPMLIPPVACLIVGAHFLPLARLFDQPQYRWTGILLCVAAVVGFVILAAGGSTEATRVVVGLAAAFILWASALHVAFRG